LQQVVQKRNQRACIGGSQTDTELIDLLPPGFNFIRGAHINFYPANDCIQIEFVRPKHFLYICETKASEMKKLSLLFISFLFLNLIRAQSPIDHLEPPCWWVGMKYNTIQLMVHGKDIGKTTATVNYSGVKVKGCTSTGPDYLFIDLQIAGNAKPGTLTIDFKEKDKLYTSWKYELKARTQGSAKRQGFTPSDFMYLIMPDRFANGDPDNDDMPGMLEKADRSNPNGRHGGDIKGISDHLDYLEKLGVTTLWCTPLLENNLPAYTYHGYAVTDLYRIDPRFGTNESYREMVNAAHQKGIKVVMDMVFNHFGTYSWWMKDLPQKDWVNQWPEFTRSNYRGGVISDPYRSKYDEKKMADGWFDVTMADFNQKNPYVAKYLIQNSIWWMEYAGLDGIRQDTYPYPDKDFMAEWMRVLREEYPNINVVGEVWINYTPQVAYWLDNKQNPDGYRSWLTNVFDFPLMGGIQKAFAENDGWDTGLARLYELLSQDFLYSDPSKLITFADNHDVERVYQVQQNVDQVKMTLAFLATTRGMPMIYYGTEALSDRGNLEGDPGKRKDFPGGWKGDDANMFTGKQLTPEQQDMLAYTTQLFNWRKSCKTVQLGKLTHYIPEDGIYVYFRTLGKESVMVVMNNHKEARTVSTARYAENLSPYSKGKDVMSGSTVKNLETLEVPAKSVRILELTK
jgi:neopullulanase